MEFSDEALAVAEQILGKLSSLESCEIRLGWALSSEFKRLKHTVSAIRTILLNVCEEKKVSRELPIGRQWREEIEVGNWREPLEDVLYDVEEVLDDIMTEALRRKVINKGSNWKKVTNFFSSSNPLAVSHKLENLRIRLQDYDAYAKNSGFGKHVPDRTKFDFAERVPDKFAARLRREQYFLPKSDVIGRDLDKNRIVDLLLSRSSSSGCSSIENNISVLPIVGVGGIGKTTLARMVYNNDAIVSNFETRIWICASGDLDIRRLIEKILNDATRACHAHLDLDQLQACLGSNLDSKKFLLVLDDVWNEDPEKWAGLKDLLSCGSCGSKIVVTTRDRITAKIMGTFPMYELKGLRNDDSMSLFIKWAFGEGQEKYLPEELLRIGMRMVELCQGLPLAVKILGSLLYTKREEDEWIAILRDIRRIERFDNVVLCILKLSYDELPLHLKQCFAYCASLQNNIDISNFDLIEAWMANGFIQSSNGSQDLEAIGNKYFHELLSRSFLEDAEMSFDNVIIFVRMHDLVHDLACLIGTGVLHVEYHTELIYKRPCRLIFERLYGRPRHLLFSAVNLEGKEFPQLPLELKKVCSFSFEFDVGPVNKTFLDTLIKTFKCLRLLDLSGSEFQELPSSVGGLTHLRYLSVSRNDDIQALPNTICQLVNLQTLCLSGCVMLQDLPRDFGNLWSLRNLYLTSQVACFPETGLVEGLSSLQYLWISRCYYLESLLEGMQNLSALRHLYIYECPNLTSLPAQSMRYLSSLEKLSIWKCEKLNLLEEGNTKIELPRGLLSLLLWEIPKLKSLPRGFENAAATIKYIRIENCPCFEILPQWLEKCISLSKLQLEDCMLLESLPLGMPRLAALQELCIVNCSEELSRKCKRETGEYWPWISQIPDFINRCDMNSNVLINPLITSPDQLSSGSSAEYKY
ncbi:hypothetical protein LguiB_028492 [Lonicera macranthoides]